ncbi:hypothetical protein ScPMuIL_008131 [Solemya velum]
MAEEQEQTTGVEEHCGKIVVLGIDGSDPAKYAFSWYKDNVHDPTDRVILVHTVEVNEVLHSKQWQNSPYTFDKNVLVKMLEEEKEKIKKKLEGFAQMLTECKMNGTVKSVHAANPGEGLVRVAKEVNATVIITGTRGLSAVRRTLLGSVSDYVLHHSPIPVVVCSHKDS